MHEEKKTVCFRLAEQFLQLKINISKSPFPKTYEKQSLEAVALLYMQFTDGDLLLSCN